MDTPELLEAGQPGRLPDHATRFTAKGVTFLEPRFLALEEAPGHEAHGLVAGVTAARWAALSGHEVGYQEKIVEVITTSGTVRVRTLVLDPDQRVVAAAPSARYADRLVAGARAAGLPDAVVSRYRQAGETGPRLTRWLRPLIRMITWSMARLGRLRT